MIPKYTYFIQLSLLFFIAATHEASAHGKDLHKIVYLISPSRSLSVAFTQAMNARGDFEIFSEPSQYAYCMANLADLGKFGTAEALRFVYKDEAAPDFNEVKNRLYDAAKTGMVFAKEISYAVDGFLHQDTEFITNPSVYFIFLVRDPHHSAISFYKKTSDQTMGNWDFWRINWSFWLGYESQLKLFNHIKNLTVNKPIIIRTEDVYNDLSGIMQSLCTHLGIDYKPEALEWSAQGNTDEWHEIKHAAHATLWHQEAMNSTTIQKPSTYDVDAQGLPTFCEITDDAHHKICQDGYQKNMPFYQELVANTEYLLTPLSK